MTMSLNVPLLLIAKELVTSLADLNWGHSENVKVSDTGNDAELHSHLVKCGRNSSVENTV